MRTVTCCRRREPAEPQPGSSVDDTGARHAVKNGFCTQIGNDGFRLRFGTRTSKSRLNFLDLLCAPGIPAIIASTRRRSTCCMRGRDLAGTVIDQLAAHQQTRFADQACLAGRISISLASAQCGSPRTQSASPPGRGAVGQRPGPWAPPREMVIVSDDAGQFDVGHHALYWVHAGTAGAANGRHFCDLHRTAQQHARTHLAGLLQ